MQKAGGCSLTVCVFVKTMLRAVFIEKYYRGTLSDLTKARHRYVLFSSPYVEHKFLARHQIELGFISGKSLIGSLEDLKLATSTAGIFG